MNKNKKLILLIALNSKHSLNNKMKKSNYLKILLTQDV